MGFVLKRDKPEAEAIARELIPWLASEGRAAVLLPEHAGLVPGVAVATEAEMGAAVDLLVCLGGDGTLLRAAGIAGDRGAHPPVRRAPPRQ